MYVRSDFSGARRALDDGRALARASPAEAPRCTPRQRRGLGAALRRGQRADEGLGCDLHEPARLRSPRRRRRARRRVARDPRSARPKRGGRTPSAAARARRGPEPRPPGDDPRLRSGPVAAAGGRRATHRRRSVTLDNVPRRAQRGESARSSTSTRRRRAGVDRCDARRGGEHGHAADRRGLRAASSHRGKRVAPRSCPTPAVAVRGFKRA